MPNTELNSIRMQNIQLVLLLQRLYYTAYCHSLFQSAILKSNPLPQKKSFENTFHMKVCLANWLYVYVDGWLSNRMARFYVN